MACTVADACDIRDRNPNHQGARTTKDQNSDGKFHITEYQPHNHGKNEDERCIVKGKFVDEPLGLRF